MQTNRVLMRHLALEHQGGGQQYQNFKRTIDASPYLYKHDFHVYNDHPQTRHLRNIAQIRYIQQLIRDQKIQPQMLKHNVYNTFYPSYVLQHHYDVFLPMLMTLAKAPQTKDIIKAAKINKITGAFFSQTRKADMKGNCKQTPVLDNNGILKMNEKVYFYSLVTSPYITHAAFISKHKNGHALTVFTVRDDSGAFVEGIKIHDFGATISSDYLPIGYNFSGVKPSLVVPLEAEPLKLILTTPMRQNLMEFSYSLKDFQKSLWLTLKYTSMRKQFQTIEGSKEERNIITYQAVASRIIEAFCQFQALSDLFTSISNYSKGFIVYSELLLSSHHVILQHLIQLRQCCGGFGFMQVSGHPGCIERVCNRSGHEPSTHLSTSNNFLKATQFYTGSQSLQTFFRQEITEPSISYMQFMSVFLSICLNMKDNKEKMSSFNYRREFLKQCGIILMHRREDFFRFQADNIHCQMLIHLLYSYILKNSYFIEWKLVKIDKKIFFEELNEKRQDNFEQIVSKLSSLKSTLELDFLRNTVVGRENESEFYEELFNTSKNNLRNSQEYREYVRAPIIELLTEQRAKI